MPRAAYTVLLTEGAEHDLESIYDHIAVFDSAANAGYGLDRLLKATNNFANIPEHGSYPRDLQALAARRLLGA
jgi:toxin ParE1/3/4